MTNDEEKKRMIVTQANLLAQGLVTQHPDRMELTPKGYQVAHEKWMSFSDEDKLLLAGFLKKIM